MSQNHLETVNYLEFSAVNNKSELLNQIITLLTKDQPLYGHSQRVAFLANLLAIELGLNINLSYLHFASLLHDFGKIYLPAEIINSKNRLSPLEYSIIKTHTFFGRPLGQLFSCSEIIANYISSHHERYDGNGYPSSLKGEEIPVGARLIALADAFDAMVSERPYRKALTLLEAIEEIKINQGAQFDPAFTDAFLQIITNSHFVSYWAQNYPADKKQHFMLAPSYAWFDSEAAGRLFAPSFLKYLEAKILDENTPDIINVAVACGGGIRELAAAIKVTSKDYLISKIPLEGVKISSKITGSNFISCAMADQ